MANEELKKLNLRLHAVYLKMLEQRVANSKAKTQPKLQSEAVKAFMKKNNELDGKLAQVKMDLSLIKLSNDMHETRQDIKGILNSISIS